MHLHAAPAQVSMVAEWLQIGRVSFAHNNRPQCPCVYKPLDVEFFQSVCGGRVYELNVSGLKELY